MILDYYKMRFTVFFYSSYYQRLKMARAVYDAIKSNTGWRPLSNFFHSAGGLELHLFARDCKRAWPHQNACNSDESWTHDRRHHSVTRPDLACLTQTSKLVTRAHCQRIILHTNNTAIVNSKNAHRLTVARFLALFTIIFLS